MSLTKELLAEALIVIGATEDEVAAWIDRTLKETGDDDLRAIRERQLANPIGSSTPLHQQITNSEFHLWKLEEAVLPLLKKVLPKLFAIEQKRARIATLKKAGERRATMPRLGDREGRRVFLTMGAELTRLGATQWKVRQLGDDERIIVADLVKWKAEDPTLADPANPWRALRAVYAERTIRKTEAHERPAKRSGAGAPPPDGPHRTSDRYWRFDEADGVDHPSAVVAQHEGNGSAEPPAVSPSSPVQVVPVAPDRAAGRTATVRTPVPPRTVTPTAPTRPDTGKPAFDSLRQSAADLALDHARRIVRERQAAIAATSPEVTAPPTTVDHGPAPPPPPVGGQRPRVADLIKATRAGRTTDHS